MHNRTRSFRPFAHLILAVAACVAWATPSLAIDFTVYGYDLGERIDLTDGRSVWTAELDVSLEGVADGIASFCVDVDASIGIGDYSARDVLDAYSSESPKDEVLRDFRWAGYVMDRYGADIDMLVDADTTRDQAITGVQAAIWEGIYGGGMVEASSLSDGARAVYDEILGSSPLALPDGPALVVDFEGVQDQVVSVPVPEPSAALVFGLGSVIAGCAVRRR